MPLKAKAFLISVVVLGVACVMVGLCFAWPHAHTVWYEPVLFILLSILVGGKKIRLTRRKENDEASMMSLGFALIFASMLRFGLTWALFVGMATSLASCVYPKRQAFYQIAFNLAATAVEVFGSSLVYFVLGGWSPHLTPVHAIIALSIVVVVNFLLDTGMVATIIAFCTNRNPIAIWNEHFLITAPTYFYGAAVGAVSVYVFRSNVTFVLIALSPIAFFTYRALTEAGEREAEKQQYIEKLQLSQKQLAELYLATIKSLALAIDAKDQYTHQHILRVQRYAVAIAKHMQLDENDIEGVNTGALLHDIGKLGVPEYVLLKPGRLTDEEFQKIKQHPEIGAAILDPVEFPWPVLSVVKYHHEKWDGTGYPEGLKGEEIPLTARVLAVADVYDALTSSRSYRNAWSHERAVAEIQRTIGTHFDPQVVEAFLLVIDGVVAEMATEGVGPLAPRPIAPPAQSAITDKSAKATQQIQRTSTELFALYEVAQTLSCSLGLEETLNILARKLEVIFPNTTCVFMLYDDQQVLSARAVVGLNREFFLGAQVYDSAGPSVQAMRQHESYNGPYQPEDLLFTNTPPTPWVPLQTALIVPIAHEEKVLGTINLYHAQEEAFNAHAQQLLEMIATRAAMPIFNGMLYDRTRGNAITDPLTGLYNVRFLTEHVQEKCHRISLRSSVASSLDPADEKVLRLPYVEAVDLTRVRAADAFAILCLDVDSFKPINDNFGHQRGDQVLRDLSVIFRGMVREEDFIARYGGDEFVVLLNGIKPADAYRMAERLQHAVEAYDSGLVHERLGPLKLGISVGVACYPMDGTDWETLFANADSRMYRNKTDRKLGRLAEAPTSEKRHNKPMAL
jgi:diguanylate cyclase (GGDEF)-like protein/putative nucleotidyltransferase with HDIG domain